MDRLRPGLAHRLTVGGEQWVELDWNQPVTTNGSSVYFLDDGGGVRLPAPLRGCSGQASEISQRSRPARMARAARNRA